MVSLIKPEIFEPYNDLIAILTTKKSAGQNLLENFNLDGGFNFSFTKNSEDEKVNLSREILFRQLGISMEQIAIPKQIHSSNVCVVDKPGVYENCDALVTDRGEIYLVVSVADCAPVYVYDVKKKAIGLIHCGWRGAKGRIVEKTIDLMVKNFGSDVLDLIAYIGPCASVCCYEVDKEFEALFDVRFLRFKRNGKFHFDLKGEIFSQLVKAGVNFKNIGVSNYCTICNSDLFHSYRRDAEKSGRMWALFGIKQLKTSN